MRTVNGELELTPGDASKVLHHQRRVRLMNGDFRGGEDIAALRRFTHMTQETFAEGLGISVHTLRSWEQNQREPDGAAIRLLSLVARDPRLLRKGMVTAK